MGKEILSFGALLKEIDEAYNNKIMCEYENIDGCTLAFYPVSKEQIKKLNSIKDNDIKSFISKLVQNDFNKMSVCLVMYSFLENHFKKPPQQKNHKRAYTLTTLQEIADNNPQLTKKEHIQLTADRLKISFNAVRNHIYRKKQS